MTREMKIEAAVERYLKEKRQNVSESTLYNHSSQLKQFIEWCDASDDRPDKVGEIDPFHISDFSLDRSEDLEEVTHYNQMSMLRVFIKWCEGRKLIDNLSEGIVMPTVENETKDDFLEPERGSDIIEYLQKYDYACFKHALFSVLWTTGMRVGTARGIDLRDFNSNERYVEVVHRPDEETPLKNKHSAERQINLHDWVCHVLDDYIEDRRIESKDDYSRKPLFSTNHGRASRSTLRKKIRTMTRPCEFSGECPYDRRIEDCEATHYSKAADCPGSVSPHPLRRSAITNYLNEGHSKELISARVDVSVKVLEKHYDARTKDQKRELRREMFEMD
jgi:site-specific recombinase XerD